MLRRYFRLVWVFLLPIDVLVKIVFTCSHFVLVSVGLAHDFRARADGVALPGTTKEETTTLEKKMQAALLMIPPARSGPPPVPKVLVIDPIPALCYVRVLSRSTAAVGDTSAELVPPSYTGVVVEKDMGCPVHVWVRPYATQLLRAMMGHPRRGYGRVVLVSTWPPAILSVVLQGLDPRRLLAPHDLLALPNALPPLRRHRQRSSPPSPHAKTARCSPLHTPRQSVVSLEPLTSCSGGSHSSSESVTSPTMPTSSTASSVLMSANSSVTAFPDTKPSKHRHRSTRDVTELTADARHVVVLTAARDAFASCVYRDNLLCIPPYCPPALGAVERGPPKLLQKVQAVLTALSKVQDVRDVLRVT